MSESIIGIVGLGYVGLPLAVEFGRKFKTIGYDISSIKIGQLKKYLDVSNEITTNELRQSINLTFVNEPDTLKLCDFLIIAVPTPVDKAHVPDFTPLIKASEMIGRHMKRGSIVIYESTVYPGATEDICIPILERSSGMEWKIDFNVGYSPERVNPGDKIRTLKNIVKVVSGDLPHITERLSKLYSEIISAGIHKVSSIKVAEASKVIENIQRDVNIALMNELSIVFGKIGIDTEEVLKAAGTKWNFLPFRPGLVGGHCIGVDPYYLTHKAEMLGYHPQMILSGRRINDGMAKYIADNTLQAMIKLGSCNKGDAIIILGFTFKENCSDIRNTRVADIVKILVDFGINVYINDPIANPQDVMTEYGLKLTEWNSLPKNARAIIAAVSHEEYIKSPIDKILTLLSPNSVFSDVKSAYCERDIRAAGHYLWRL